jgi:hypothetical protein
VGQRFGRGERWAIGRRNAVDLKRVADDASAARFVGRWVVATGDGVLVSGCLVALDHAVVELAHDTVLEYVNDEVLTIEQILASAPGPDPNDAGLNLTQDESEAFWSALAEM